MRPIVERAEAFYDITNEFYNDNERDNKFPLVDNYFKRSTMIKAREALSDAKKNLMFWRKEYLHDPLNFVGNVKKFWMKLDEEREKLLDLNINHEDLDDMRKTDDGLHKYALITGIQGNEDEYAGDLVEALSNMQYLPRIEVWTSRICYAVDGKHVLFNETKTGVFPWSKPFFSASKTAAAEPAKC
jgi:hypothetical protein